MKTYAEQLMAAYYEAFSSNPEKPTWDKLPEESRQGWEQIAGKLGGLVACDPAWVAEVVELLQQAQSFYCHEVGGAFLCIDRACDDLHDPPRPCWGQRMRAAIGQKP